jgi:predicted phosphodiesterase
MTGYRIIHVSDTHLSRTHAYFYDNWRVFVDAMRADPPDLIVHTGDISLNGMHHADDLVFAQQELARLPGRVLILPGNHDIGDNPPDRGSGHTVNEERRQRWIDLFGPDWWCVDLDGWRIIGLDSQLFDSGMPAEREQWACLESVLAGAEGRQTLIFLHKPICYHDMAEQKVANYCLHPNVRHAIAALLERHHVGTMASGHLHTYRVMEHGGLNMVWAPATAFINTAERGRPPITSMRRPGYLEFRLTDAGAEHAFVEPPLFIGHDVRNWSMMAGTTISLPPRPLVGAWDSVSVES